MKKKHILAAKKVLRAKSALP